MSKQLATIKLDCPLDISLDSMRIEDMFNDQAYQLFKQLELKSVLKRFTVPAEVPETMTVDVKVLEDFMEVEYFFQQLSECQYSAIQCVIGEQGLLGVTIATETESAI